MVTPPRVLRIRDMKMFVADEDTCVIDDVPFHEKKEIAFHSRQIFVQWMDNP